MQGRLDAVIAEQDDRSPPAAAEPLITRAAEAVKILDDLGLVIRLV